jgi:hypothetical protein
MAYGTSWNLNSKSIGKILPAGGTDSCAGVTTLVALWEAPPRRATFCKFSSLGMEDMLALAFTILKSGNLGGFVENPNLVYV